MANEMFGKYEIRGRLGAGAMGTVFDAFDPVIERRAALKTVRRPAPDDPDGAEAMGRFKREAQAAGRLNHPHIVAVYDYGEDAQAAWIAMELVEGGTLKDPLDRGDRFPLAQTLRIMEQVLAALDYSHRRGVVHRDIKPANIMLTADGQVKIADFGIARIENSAMTQVGTIMGTPAYMAPEQLRGEAVDSRADIWAAGVVLYQLLTGEKPFAGGYSSVQHKALNTEPTPPSALSVTAPRAFDGVIARAMAKRPDDRFATADAFAEALRGAMVAAVPEDATMVATQAQVKTTPAITTAAPLKKRQPMALIAGGGGLLAAAAVAAFLAFDQPTPTVVAQAPETPRPGPAARTTTGATPGPTLAPPLILAPAPPVAPVLAPTLPPSVGPTQGPTPGPTTLPTAGPTPPQPVPAVRTEARMPQAPAQPRESSGGTPLPTPSPGTIQELPPGSSQGAASPAPGPMPPTQPNTGVPPTQPPRLTNTNPGTGIPSSGAPNTGAPLTGNPGVIIPGTSPPLAAAPNSGTLGPGIPGSKPAPEPRSQIAVLPPPRIDFRAAAAAAAAAPACALLAISAADNGLAIEGVLRRGEEATLRRVLALRDVPATAARLSLHSFDGPYCPAFDTLRPVLAPPDSAPRLRLVGNSPLLAGQLLRFDVAMPDWPAQLTVSYFMSNGEVAHLAAAAHPAGTTVRLGEPRVGFPGWDVSEPFGTDLMVALVSDGPLFATARPDVEPQQVYIAALAEALARARAAGRRVLARPMIIDTAPR